MFDKVYSKNISEEKCNTALKKLPALLGDTLDMLTASEVCYDYNFYVIY